ncbi:MAG: N,N-dimethylformamidase [Mesorhizobium sp.]|nr:N,N-dimethylformamidase [Mesorhizobium sp.]
MALPYCTGYLDRISLTRGERLKVMVSCTAASTFSASLVRTVCGDLNPDGPGFCEIDIPSAADGTYPAREQICNAGSCIVVPPNDYVDALGSFSVQMHIWPTTPLKGEQVLLALWDEEAGRGFRLFIDERGALAACVSDGSGTATVTPNVALIERQWHLVGASYDVAANTLTVIQEPYSRTGAGERPLVAQQAVPFAFSTPVGASLTLAARMTGGTPSAPLTAQHYNGKIEKPRLLCVAASRLDMEKFRGEAIPTDVAPLCVAFWDFSVGIDGERIADRSRHGLHGDAVNLPARGMTGSNWTGEEVSWRVAPAQYGAIHFHEDDIYDARWQADIDFALPDDLRSGFYAIRLIAGADEERIPFFVRPKPGDRRAPVCLLASTATYMAYANLNPVPFPIAELLSSRLIVLHKANLLIDEHPEWGPSLYDVHSDGSGVCYSSRLRPILNFRPGYISSFGAKGSNLREFNADTHIVDWLEQQGIDYDVITDDDLHTDGFPLLSQYKTVITGAHPEYFSAEMWDATKSYTDAGGRMMVLGGNSFYWRIAYHSTLPGVMEVRRCGAAIRTWETQPGEEFHSFDGKRGGLWRAQGRPPQSIGGVGFISEGFDLAAFYRRTAASRDPRAAFVFQGVDEEIIGDFGLQGGGAAGIEIDHADTNLGTPTHALILASSEGHTESFRLVNEEMSITVPTVTAPVEARIQADMVFFETAGGGAVFNVGSIAWPGSLSHNGYVNNVSRITRNVLDRFTDPTPFEYRRD